MKNDTTTRELLFNSALELFASNWYETVSVAEICRRAGLSNGIFYHYYKKKESIFRELLDRFMESLEKNMESIRGKTVSDRLGEFLTAIADAGKSLDKLLTIFREGQYRFPEYERRLRDMYILTLSRVYGRNIDPAEYLYITSGVRFLTNRTVQTGVPFV